MAVAMAAATAAAAAAAANVCQHAEHEYVTTSARGPGSDATSLLTSGVVGRETGRNASAAGALAARIATQVFIGDYGERSGRMDLFKPYSEPGAGESWHVTRSKARSNDLHDLIEGSRGSLSATVCTTPTAACVQEYDALFPQQSRGLPPRGVDDACAPPVGAPGNEY